MQKADIELAHSLAAGCEDAARLLVDTHYEKVGRFFLGLGHTPDDASDLTQETFLKARLRASTYRGEAPLKTWLYRIAVREHGMFVRRRRLTAPFDSVFGRAATIPGLDPDGIALWEAIGRLSDALRTTFVLHEVVGCPTAEVAATLDVPLGTVTSRLSLARKRLRDLLQANEETPGHARTQFES